MTSASELVWRKSAYGFTLHLHNRGPALVAVVPDDICPGMWRVRRPDGGLSDLANVTRAKDATASVALVFINHRKKQDQETPSEAPPVRQNVRPYVSGLSDIPATQRGAQ
jgi:hypothetical protein